MTLAVCITTQTIRSSDSDQLAPPDANAEVDGPILCVAGQIGMPRRGDKDSPGLPTLVVTRKDAADRMSVQIKRGWEILSRRTSSTLN